MCKWSEIFLLLLSVSLLYYNIFVRTRCNLVSYHDYERDGAMETCR